MAYYGVVRSGDYLEHYGITGMKWGIRKKEPPHSDKYTAALQKLEAIGRQRTHAANNTMSRERFEAVSRRPIVNKHPNARHPSDTTGRYGRGNIDLNKRQVVHNRDGSISTERSFSVNIDGKETLLPTVINGKVVDEDTAINHYFRTGEHLGRFDTVEEAEEYAEQLHNRQDWYYNRKQKQK